MTGPVIFTIGHSNRELAEFADLLVAHEIKMLVDVRAFPGSRRLPHFGSEQLAATLRSMSIDYLHERDLGGRRKLRAAAESNGCGDGWRNSSFRAYAEYAQSDQYMNALEELVARSESQRTAIMCSEAVPWRCHRWLISDTLVGRDIHVGHILGPAPSRQHELSSFARVTGKRVMWPGPPSETPLHLGPALTVSSC